MRSALLRPDCEACPVSSRLVLTVLETSRREILDWSSLPNERVVGAVKRGVLSGILLGDFLVEIGEVCL